MRKPQNILVVDDDAVVLRFVTNTLTRQGFTVHSAASGDDGLRYFTQHGNALWMILTDVLMPGLTGPEMVERALAIAPETRVMFMTGTAEEAKLPSFEDKRYRLIRKPFTTQSLLEMVRECLDQ